MSLSRYPPRSSATGGYGLYECSCCPYGYHIDLDFVRYCESICQETERTGSIKRRRDRRRQRQSMEVLLGITPPTSDANDQEYKPFNNNKSPTLHRSQAASEKFVFLDQDDFENVVSDFEKTTLEYSKNKYNNLPDVTFAEIRRVPSLSSISSASNSSTMAIQTEAAAKEFDSVSIESCGLSPVALQKIREQMALSLERTRELEEKVKLLPGLEDQLRDLREENRKLLLQLKASESKLISNANASYITSPSESVVVNRKRSLSFTDGSENVSPPKQPPTPPRRKDFGVMCGVLMRNIGVGHQQTPNTKSVATTTINSDFDYSDKWYSEKLKFMNSHDDARKQVNVTSRSTQTLLDREKRDIGIQSVLERLPLPKLKVNSSSQTITVEKSTVNVGVTVSPQCRDFNVQKTVESVSVGVSDDSVSDVLCEKCKVEKKTVAVGPESPEDSHTCPISLASLSTRSKSFNLGEDKLNLNYRNRTVSCQTEHHNVSNKGCQYEIKTHSRASQHNNVKVVDKVTQSERSATFASKLTDTKDLIRCSHKGCEAGRDANEAIGNNRNGYGVREVGVNTDAIQLEKHPVCSKCSNSGTAKDNKEEVIKKEGGSPTPSRIPRPQIPTTPSEVRKFKRQDTYTKVYMMPDQLNLSTGQSNLETPRSGTDNSTSLERTKSLQLQDIPPFKALNGVSAASTSETITTATVQETSLPTVEIVSLTSINQTQRKKAEPSKEMCGAMKVLNDSLHKTSAKNFKNHTAINIIQQEWFKVSSLVTANPLDVEDYLDVFEEMSSLLLEYIVNMTDASGNTAMHYAVSHGNFDVVSILLDSKVCDINKANKAGYTCVMLVSLAQVKSQTHANVIKRLFSLADVNIRAKQHGQTALMLAVSHGRLDMVSMLVEAGADINIQDADGSTALMCAAEHGHIEIVKYFLNQPDCDSSIADVDGSTALKIAMEAGHRHIGVLLYAHERNLQMAHGNKIKKSKMASPNAPSSPLPPRNNPRALNDTKNTK